MFKAKDIMNTDLVTVCPEDTADHAISMLLEHGISGLPVVNKAGSLVGVVSEFDLLEMVCDCWTEKDKVSDYMTSDVRKVGVDDDWVEVADMFRADQLRRLPVTRKGKLVGIITRHDLMRSIQNVRQLAQHEHVQ